MTALPHNTPIRVSEQPEQTSDAKPLAGPIAALKVEIDRALTIGDGHLAELAHELLTEAEWAQRCLETVRRCAR
jgi:hypothetical protein